MRVWTHPKLLETHSLKREFSELLVEHEEAESDLEELAKNVNSDDEEIAILEDGDPGLNSTDDERSKGLSRPICFTLTSFIFE